MNNQTRFTARFDFSELLGDKKIVSSSVGPNGEAILFAVAGEFEHEPFGKEERKGFAIFPLSKARWRYPAVFIRFDRNVIQKTELAEVEIAFPFVQPLPDGEILVVGARCHFRKGNPEKNAVVYGPDGKLRRQFVLGDGINGVQTTNEGMIWVSYCDEGVFGNFGWEKPLGAAGLLCFDCAGHIIWEFQPPDGVDPIADCYAFNVCGDTVWTCYYTDFPLVRIDSRNQVRAWKNNVGGASALAVYGDHVLLWGGYGDKRARGVLQHIQDEALAHPVELRLTLPSGLDTVAGTLIGHGSILHAFSGSNWFTFELADATPRVGSMREDSTI